jgi:hypothetical protein
MPPDEGGWVLLGERPRDEIALGLVGKFWRPVIEFATVPAERFRVFAEPGCAKTIVTAWPDFALYLAGDPAAPPPAFMPAAVGRRIRGI